MLNAMYLTSLMHVTSRPLWTLQEQVWQRWMTWIGSGLHVLETISVVVFSVQIARVRTFVDLT